MKIINLAPVEMTVNSSNTDLIYRKVTGIDETRNVSIRFHGSLTSIPKDGSIYQITHILISPFNYRRILKTTAHATVELCDNEKVTINVSGEDILTSFEATVSETKIVARYTKNFYRKHVCAYLVNRQ